jgi:hypothetical protein
MCTITKYHRNHLEELYHGRIIHRCYVNERLSTVNVFITKKKSI